jgi:probable phosphoglycerate mutase
LDETGREQSIEAAVLIAALQPDYIVSSDLRRAAQTAETLSKAAERPLHLDRRFRERSLGTGKADPRRSGGALSGRDVRLAGPDGMCRGGAGRAASRSRRGRWPRSPNFPP